MPSCNFSIIIPHHNNVRLLNRCLSSIPQREDLQIIVVDDKSDDAYLSELEELKSRFPLVEYACLRENGGGGKARNFGLKYARGTYVLFADCDDFFNYCIADVLDDYAKIDVDVVFFNAISLDTDTYNITYRARHLNHYFHVKEKDRKKAEECLRYRFGEPWCKLIKRNVIESNHIAFDESKIHNDTRFSYLVGYYCKKCIIDERALYCITDRRDSVSRRVSRDRLLIRTRVFAEANIFFKLHGIKIFEEKAMRPMMNYLLRGNLKDYMKCREILKKSGMSNMEIVVREFFYPWMILKKLWVNLQEIRSILPKVRK